MGQIFRKLKSSIFGPYICHFLVFENFDQNLAKFGQKFGQTWSKMAFQHISLQVGSVNMKTIQTTLAIWSCKPVDPALATGHQRIFLLGIKLIHPGPGPGPGPVIGPDPGLDPGPDPGPVQRRNEGSYEIIKNT